MQALENCVRELPYRGVVPWPVVEYNGQSDWVSSVSTVEAWLDLHVGRDWMWTQWTLHQPNLCSVSFAREQDSLLFLLRFS